MQAAIVLVLALALVGMPAVPLSAAAPNIQIKLSADKNVPVEPNRPVTFRADVTGDVSKPFAYRWWVFQNNQWALVQEWSPNNQFTHTFPAENPNGSVAVWVKQADAKTEDHVPAVFPTPVLAAKDAPGGWQRDPRTGPEGGRLEAHLQGR